MPVLIKKQTETEDLGLVRVSCGGLFHLMINIVALNV